MEPESQGCSNVLAEIEYVIHAGDPTSLSSTTYRHLGICSRCQAGLLLLIRAFDPEPAQSGTISACDRIHADLAAFIDLESENPALAAATYSHVWWHLWMCQTCLQTYEFTHILLNAQRAGELPRLRLPKSTAQPLRAFSLCLPRRFLAQVLLPSIALSPVFRGAGNEQHVLFEDAEDEMGGRQFTVAVEKQADGLWSMRVTIRPPLDSLLIITAGALRLTTPFDSNGTATTNNILPDILLHPDGPDLEVSVVVLD